MSLDDLRQEPVTAAMLQRATERILNAITQLVSELRGQEAPAVMWDPRSPSGGR